MQQHVRRSVAVEVPTPATFHAATGAEPRLAPRLMAPLLMIQVPTSPVVWCATIHPTSRHVEIPDAGHLPHRYRGRAEARAATDGAVADDPGADLSVVWLCSNTSDVPSPSKSPTPATIHAATGPSRGSRRG